MQRLRNTHSTLCEGWKIVKGKDKRVVVKRSHELSMEGIKRKMEESIEKAVLEEMIESGRDKEYDAQEQLVKKHLEERKRKLIQAKNEQSKRCKKGVLKMPEENKLRIVYGKLEETKDKLELLLFEADKDTIKENIPEAARKKCLDTWSKARDLRMKIKETLLQKTGVHFEEYFSAGEKLLTSTMAKVSKLEAIVDALNGCRLSTTRFA